MRFGSLLCVLVLAGCTSAQVSPTTDAGTALGDAAFVDASPSDDAALDVDSGLPAFPVFSSLLAGAGNATLFVGNSYTFVNDLPTAYRALAADGSPLRVESATTGGYTLAQHAADLATDGTPIATFLRTGPPADNLFDVVVLQDQSEIPGFPDGSPELLASLDGASTLGMAADGRGASAVLYLTWGREHGDTASPGLYPDFTTMEQRLEAGYRAYAARLEAEGTPVRIAPVGPAFARVHDAVLAAGLDPEAVGSDFDRLYSADGSHPAARGTYLAACVIFSTITGRDPSTLGDAPSLGLRADETAALRLVARATLADPSWTPAR